MTFTPGQFNVCTLIGFEELITLNTYVETKLALIYIQYIRRDSVCTGVRTYASTPPKLLDVQPLDLA